METIYHLLDVPADKKDELKKAISTPDGFAKWWTAKTESPENDVIRFHFGGGYFKDFKSKKKEENRLEYQCLQGHPEWIDTTLRFEWAENDGKLTLQFRHFGWKDQTPMFGICNFQWALYMKSLKDFLETGKGNPTEVK